MDPIIVDSFENMIEKSVDRPCRRAAVNQLCRICSDKAHGFHFGVMVCRACAAFFRRTVALNLKYHCRFEWKCEVNANGEYQSVRSICRACRYNKCINFGMKTDAVQINKDKSSSSTLASSPTSSLEPSTPLATLATPHNSPATTASLSSPRSNPSPLPAAMDAIETELFNQINNIFEASLINPRTSVDLSIIDQFRIGLNQLRMNRQTKHTVQLVELAPFHGKEEFKTVWKENWEKISQMSVDEIELIAEMCSYIRPFVLLPADQRWIMFKQFWLSFARLERAYETFRVHGDDVNDTRTLLYNGQCISIFAALMDEAQHLENSELRNVVQIFRPTRILMVKGLVMPIKRLKPTEFEFAVMCLQLLWQHPGLETITDETQSISNLCRQQAFNELHYYYTQQLGISNYAVRLGEFMALMVTVEKYIVRRKENMIITELFSPVKVNPALLSATR